MVECHLTWNRQSYRSLWISSWHVVTFQVAFWSQVLSSASRSKKQRETWRSAELHEISHIMTNYISVLWSGGTMTLILQTVRKVSSIISTNDEGIWQATDELLAGNSVFWICPVWTVMKNSKSSQSRFSIKYASPSCCWVRIIFEFFEFVLKKLNHFKPLHITYSTAHIWT